MTNSKTLARQLVGLVERGRKELCERSFYAFVKEFWSTIEPKAYIDGWHIRAICDHLQAVTEGDIQNLLINIPPRHGKSLLINVFYPAWVWIRRASKKFIFFSYAKVLTIRDSVKCRRVVESARYQAWWGKNFQLVKDQNTKSRFENNHGGVRIASSVGGSATGEGGDVIGVDDPHNAFDIESASHRETIIEDWWKGTLSTRDDDPKNTARIVVMQRLHHQDLTGHILKNEPNDWTFLILPIRFDPSRVCKTCIGFVDPRTQSGELLWPARYTPEQEEKLRRRLGSRKSAGQLDQRPDPAEGGMLKRHWWKRDRLHPYRRAELCEEIIQSWDMPFKKKVHIKKNGEEAGSDYLACFVMGRIGVDIYLLDLLMVRAEISEAIRYVLQMSKKWPTARKKLMENKAYAPALMDLIRKKITGIEPIEPKGDKTQRVRVCEPVAECGNIWIPEDHLAPWADQFIDNAAKFPTVEHDDDIDCFSQGVIWLLGEEEQMPLFSLLGL